MKFLTLIGLALVPMLLVISTLAVRAEQYKGDKYHGRIESTMQDMLVLLTGEDQLVEFIVADDATITRNVQPSSLDDLEQGDIAFVKATRKNGRLLAVRISATAPE
jgi:hypothetical protein